MIDKNIHSILFKLLVILIIIFIMVYIEIKEEEKNKRVLEERAKIECVEYREGKVEKTPGGWTCIDPKR